MADLTSFDTFRRTAPPELAERISELISRGLPARFDIDSWRLGRDEFDGPTERYSAAAYALYRRKCHRKGVEPGPFETASDE